MSFIDRIGPHGISASFSAAMTSNLVLVSVQCSMIEKHSGMRGSRASGVAMHAGAAVADLRAGDSRRPVLPAGRAGSAAHALRDILIRLEIGVAAGAEPLDRGVDDAWVQFLKARPGEALPVENARPKVF